MSEQLNPLLRNGSDSGINWNSDDSDEFDGLQNRSSINFRDGLSYPKYPKEKRKTLLSFGLLVLGLFCNSVSIALVHDRLPDRDKYPPLPDAVLDNILIIPDLMKVPDVFVFITIFMTGVVIALHRHRWIIVRRTFFILSILYGMRSITIYATVLPVSNYTVYCEPKSNSSTASVIFQRAFNLIGGGGMQISGNKTTCGDYIFSGHTAILMLGYLLIKEYSPKALSIFQSISFILSWSGMAILLVARGHYTIDVIIGYYAATRMFWTYHSLANNAEFKTRSATNFHANVWWFPMLQFLEKNVDNPLPKEHSFPWENKIHNSFLQRFNLTLEKGKFQPSIVVASTKPSRHV